MRFGESIVILRPVDDIGLIPGEDALPGDELLPDALDVDEQGNPVALEPDAITSEGWAVAPAPSSEDASDVGTQSIVGFTLYKRDGWVEVRTDDRVEVRGEVFAVVSPSALWEHPLTGRRGTVVVVRRVA